jgi:hypothetical protein
MPKKIILLRVPPTQIKEGNRVARRLQGAHEAVFGPNTCHVIVMPDNMEAHTFTEVYDEVPVHGLEDECATVMKPPTVGIPRKRRMRLSGTTPTLDALVANCTDLIKAMQQDAGLDAEATQQTPTGEGNPEIEEASLVPSFEDDSEG